MNMNMNMNMKPSSNTTPRVNTNHIITIGKQELTAFFRPDKSQQRGQSSVLSVVESAGQQAHAKSQYLVGNLPTG
jgi:hypothetical protein